MIKALTTFGNKNFVLLGLSRGNLERLQKGEPIVVKGSDLSLKLQNIEIGILFGETEKDIEKQLFDEGYLDKNTIRHSSDGVDHIR